MIEFFLIFMVLLTCKMLHIFDLFINTFHIMHVQGLPHNPFVSAGAIMTVSLLKPQSSLSERFVHAQECYRSMAAGETGECCRCCCVVCMKMYILHEFYNNSSNIPSFISVGYDNAAYLSEKACAFRDSSLSYHMCGEKVRWTVRQCLRLINVINYRRI